MAFTLGLAIAGRYDHTRPYILATQSVNSHAACVFTHSRSDALVGDPVVLRFKVRRVMEQPRWPADFAVAAY